MSQSSVCDHPDLSTFQCPEQHPVHIDTGAHKSPGHISENLSEMFMDYEINSQALKVFLLSLGNQYMFTKSKELQVSRIEVKMTG